MNLELTDVEAWPKVRHKDCDIHTRISKAYSKAMEQLESRN